MSNIYKALLYGAPFLTSILLLTDETFVKTEITFVDKSNFCSQNLLFSTKVTSVLTKATFVAQK